MTNQLFKFTPVVTEKSSAEIANNKFTFITDKTLNKISFSKYIEKNFNVKVASVNVLNLKSKKRRRGRIVGRTVARKKIIVTVDSNSKLDKLKELF